MKLSHPKNYFLLLASIILFSCTKDEFKNPVIVDPVSKGKFENGFFIVNEGWAGHDPGDVNFYNYETASLTDSIFKKENAPLTLGSSWTTIEYATIYKNKMYLLSKAKGPLVVIDPYTFKEINRIPENSGIDFRAFLGIDDNTGLVSSSNGVYIMKLNSLATNLKIGGTDGQQIGDMLKAGKYIFMHSASKGLLIFNAEDYSLKSSTKNITMGFAQTPNGKVWYTGGKYLYNIDPQTLAKDSVELSFSTYSTWGAWHSGSIVASTNENAVYFVKQTSFGSNGGSIYKYIDGNKSSIDAPFITNPEKQVCYGKGIGYGPKTNQLVVTTVQSGYGENYAINNLYFYDNNGALKITLPYSGYHFPALPVFHQ